MAALKNEGSECWKCLELGRRGEQEGCVPSSASVLPTVGKLREPEAGEQAQSLKRQTEITIRFILQQKELGERRLWSPFRLVRISRTFHFQLPRLQLRVTRVKQGCVRLLLLPQSHPFLQSEVGRASIPCSRRSVTKLCPCATSGSSSPHALPPILFLL